MPSTLRKAGVQDVSLLVVGVICILGSDGSFKLGSRESVFLDKVPVNAGDVSTTVYKGMGVDGFHGV